MDDSIEVVWGPQKFAPISFHSFDVGPLTMRTTIRKGETPEQAFERAYSFLASQGRRVYEQELKLFLERVRIAGTQVQSMKTK
jgi:hypothetical protein